MRAVLAVLILGACGPGFEDYQQLEMNLDYTTEGGVTASASGPWTVSDFERESAIEVRGLVRHVQR